MSVNHFEYPDLALTVDRGKVGDPSVVMLDWVTVDDGQEHDCKLVLGCELLIDKIEHCRELAIVSVSGDADAVADFKAQTTLSNDGYERDRMEDVADGLGRAIRHSSIKHEYPELVVVRRCAQ